MLKKFKDCNGHRQDIELTLDVVADWTTNPRIKREFQNLQQDVELLEQRLQIQKAQRSISSRSEVSRFSSR